MPEGARRAASQGVWIHTVQSHPDVAVLRADAYRNLMMVAWVLARHADWTTLTTRPTWAVLMERTGLGRSTVAAWLAWLRRAGLLGTVTGGSILRYRRGTACGLLDDGRGNEAAEYVLAVPHHTARAAVTRVTAEASGAVEETWTPSCPPSGDKSSALRGRARVGAETRDTAPGWPLTATPATRRDMLEACAAARRGDLTLRRVSDRHLRSLLRPVFACGGTLGDTIHMINNLPDGRPWALAGTPSYLPGWVRYRLAAWLDEHGRLRPGVQLPSRARAAAAEQVRAEQAARRAELSERLERPADAAGHAARARALLAERGIGLGHAPKRQRPASPRPVSTPAPSATAPERAVQAFTEPEDVFRREVLQRHGLPRPARWTEPQDAFQRELTERGIDPSAPLPDHPAG
ncbi:hypothetical protein [Sphaerisporangium fuscum]|uniref:hypothetical protein n=1 Tax=Sphaerisporangium fuscum TaxID=2835868 RepID=UPI001BDD03A1|nr:hypothetical protein [Sphaerisporangium fuscum]